MSSGSVGDVEAINDLATIYSAGGTVIVTEILANPRGRMPAFESHITRRARAGGSKIDAIFVTFLFGAQVSTAEPWADGLLAAG